MTTFSMELSRALESDCARDMEPLMKAKSDDDFNGLLSVIAGKDVTPSTKVKALFALGRWGKKEAVATIRKHVTSLDELGKVSALDALGRLHSTDSLETVLQLTSDASPQVRKFAVIALSRFKSAKATKQLKVMEAEDDENYVRLTARRYIVRAAGEGK